jgi:Phosphoinositide phospholipase C, Ca2+-dependent
MGRFSSFTAGFAVVLALFAPWLFGTSVFGAAPAAKADFEALRLNQLQFIGTHNSYHVRSPTARTVKEWAYSHPPLGVQLDRGVRSFELDLHFRNDEFQVFHVPMLDEGSTCPRLADGLATVRKWSEAHPGHMPISFLFELKKDGAGLDRRITYVDGPLLDRLDTLLRDSFAPGQILTPDDVRGSAETLRGAIETTGWPTLAKTRGKVMFILHDEGKQRDLYAEGHPSLRGRAMFVRSDDKRDDGAVMILDSPNSPNVPRFAAAGYFIRSRADADLREDAAGKSRRRDKAFASGANILSTDFPTGEAQGPSQGEGVYVVEFPGAAPARVNPVSGPAELRRQTVAE